MLRFKLQFTLLLFILWSSGAGAQTAPELLFPKGVQGTVQLRTTWARDSISTSWNAEKLSVFVKNEENDPPQTIQGKYNAANGWLVFKPHYPFEKGVPYIVRTQDKNMDGAFTYKTFQIGEKDPFSQAKVLQIYPSADELPENTLRFYLYFNTPMEKGQALRHVTLMDEMGNNDRHAFMEFKQELWSTDGKRLTLLFDPGRIKKGVSTNVLRGPALLEGKRYTLRISGEWKDVHGQPLTNDTTKEFTAGHGYRKRINLADWSIEVPQANTNDPLTLKFDRILDHALLQSMIQIVRSESTEVNGHWAVLAGERMIRFVPKEKWGAGNYRVRLDNALEDIAGNNLQDLLDHPNTDEDRMDKTNRYIPFKV